MINFDKRVELYKQRAYDAKPDPDVSQSRVTKSNVNSFETEKEIFRKVGKPGGRIAK